MAIAVDTSTSYESNTSMASAWSFSHTCSGDNRVLLVLTCCYYGKVSNVRYNGVSMTEQVSQLATTPGFGYSQIWSLVNPASGDNIVYITTSENEFGMDACAISFTGAHQTSPIDGSDSTAGTSTTASLSITTSYSNTIVVDCLLVEGRGGTATATVGDSQTQFYFTNTVERGNEKQVRAGSYYQESSPTIQWTSISTSTGGGWAYTAVGVRELPPASGPANLKTYNTNLKANIKSINTNAIANVKSLDTNT